MTGLGYIADDGEDDSTAQTDTPETRGDASPGSLPASDACSREYLERASALDVTFVRETDALMEELQESALPGPTSHLMW